MRLVMIPRLSSETQLDGWGIERQRRAIRQWSKRTGHSLIDIGDEVITGTSEGTDRPVFTESLTLIRAGRADGIVASQLDRIARKLTVQETILAMVWRIGGRVFTAQDGEVLQDDPNEPMRTAMRQMGGVFAELERATLVKRMNDGRNAKAAAGKWAVGCYPFGYHGTGEKRDRDIGPNESEQAAVELIVERRRKGDSYRSIASELDAAGLKPRRSEKWSPMSVRSVALRHGA